MKEQKTEKVVDQAETSAAHRSKDGGGGCGAPIPNNRRRRHMVNVGR